MRIIRVFPRRTSFTPTDDLAFVGDPPMERPAADEVHISCAFTWDKIEAQRLAGAWGQYYETVKIGGPAFDAIPDTFIPGRYIKPKVIFTSYGCNNKCPYCLVWQREGKLKQLQVIHHGNIIQDNNLLQCDHAHLDRVFSMLSKQRMIYFTGGIDSRLVTDEIADRIRSLHIRELFLACDTESGLKPLRTAIKRLGLAKHKVYCYTLLAYDGQTFSKAEEMLENIYNAGAQPFAQLYQPPDKWIDYPWQWRNLQMRWSRPAIVYAMHKKKEGVE